MTWVTSAQAAEILSKNSGRPIKAAYVRVLASDGLIRYRQNPKDPSTNEYSAEDCEARVVRPRTAKRVTQRVRDRRKGGTPGRPRKEQPGPSSCAG